MDDPAELEVRAERHVREGDTRAAVQCFYDLATHYARKGAFVKAEAMRERLMAVDEMALTEIVRSAEIIEAEKSKAVDPDGLKVFRDLYDKLSVEETNALYLAGERILPEAGDVLFRQGAVNTRLYFIHRGQLKLYFTQAGKDQLITLLGAGDVAGQDSFWAATTCTSSLAVESRAEVQIIDRRLVASWKTVFPALETKLAAFCRTRDVGRIVTAKGLDRRRSRRLKVEGAVAAQMVDAAHAPVGKPFRGDMADISNTGLSFSIKATDKAARLLLGRRLKIAARLEIGGKPQRLERYGIAVAVTPLFFGDFAIHVKLDQPLKSA